MPIFVRFVAIAIFGLLAQTVLAQLPQAPEAKNANPAAPFADAQRLLELGKFDEAIEQYRRALRIQPLDADTHYSLGELLQRRGRPDEAASEYRETLRINPRHVAAAQRLRASTSSAPAGTR